MEFRWLTSDEQRTRAVESASLADVLALAQQLQAEGEARFTDEQVVEMGRELGVHPQYVLEALRLRRRAAQPAPLLQPEPAPERPLQEPLAQVLRASVLGLGLGTFPMAMIALAQSHSEPMAFFVLIAALAAGWSARHPRLAGLAGAAAAPLVVIVSPSFLGATDAWPGAFFLALLSFTPLSSALARMAAGLRGRIERLAEVPQLSVSSRIRS
jgi:hypothetical protein